MAEAHRQLCAYKDQGRDRVRLDAARCILHDALEDSKPSEHSARFEALTL